MSEVVVARSPHWEQAATLGASFPFAAGLVLMCSAGIAVWGALGATVALLTVLVLAVWFGITAVASRTRGYQRSRVAATLMVVVPVVVGSVGLASTPALAITPSSLIEFQIFRIVGGIFLVAWLSGETERPWFCLWAGGVDVFIGFTALPVAWWVGTGAPAAPVVGVVWNLLGLTDFAVAIVIATVDRTVLRDFFASTGPTMQVLRPIVLVIFSFAVPLVSIVHVLSIRQLL